MNRVVGSDNYKWFNRTTALDGAKNVSMVCFQEQIETRCDPAPLAQCRHL